MRTPVSPAAYITLPAPERPCAAPAAFAPCVPSGIPLLPAFAAPIGLFLMKQSMESLPNALIEAAHLDGAGESRIFWSIVMPNVKPAWLTISIFSVQSLWNTNAATVIRTESKKTLVYALQQIQAGGIARTGQAAAVTVVVMIVPITIFILFQGQIVETMASSGLKD